MLSSVFVVYTMTSIAKVFFITAGTFGAMAFDGYTTKKDLTSLGKILFMALIGLIIATIVNMFLKSSGFDYILSYAGVAIFVGLTAWDSQKIKQMLQTQYDMSEGAQKLALIGALYPVSRFYQSLPLLAPHLRRQQQGIMKTRTGNKVKNKKNNIHNEKGWLALNGLANLYFLFLEKVNARVIFSSKSSMVQR